MRFSEKYGYRPIRESLQIESIDADLRTALWNSLNRYFWDEVNDSGYNMFAVNPRIAEFSRNLWENLYKKPLDNLSGSWQEVLKIIRTYFFGCEWYEVYDFLEFTVQNFPYDTKKIFVISCNAALEKEMSAYRIIDDIVTRITNQQELAEIELALQNRQAPFTTHLQRALELLSDRKNPDYRNSIKESISAVESLIAKIFCQKATLGQLVKRLEDEIGLHPALGRAFSNLYGYTSDEDGIRHAILESQTVTFDDAKFFLVTCSAFINFVNAKTAFQK